MCSRRVELAQQQQQQQEWMKKKTAPPYCIGIGNGKHPVMFDVASSCEYSVCLVETAGRWKKNIHTRRWQGLRRHDMQPTTVAGSEQRKKYIHKWLRMVEKKCTAKKMRERNKITHHKQQAQDEENCIFQFNFYRIFEWKWNEVYRDAQRWKSPTTWQAAQKLY